MQIFYQPEEELQPVSIEELDQLAKNLNDFIREYEKRILMTEVDKVTLSKLKVIANNLKYRQYHMLMMDTNLISQSSVDDEKLPF